MSLEQIFLEALRSVTKFLARRRAAKATQTEKHRKAVSQVLAATVETVAYLYDLKSGEGKDRRQERRLATLWSRAADAIHQVDARLSKIAQVTAFGWANPDLLDQPEYKDLPKELDLIRKQCEWLLERWG